MSTSSIAAASEAYPDSAVLIFGPGGESWGADHVSDVQCVFEGSGMLVTLIGDGTECSFQTLSDGLARHVDRMEGKPHNLTIYLRAHGTEQWGEHLIELSLSEGLLSAEDLFDRLTGELGCTADSDSPQPKIGVFTPSCYGGRLHQYTGRLPYGSRVVTLSDGATASRVPTRLFKYLRTTKKSDFVPAPESLLEGVFLDACQDLAYRHEPTYSISSTLPGSDTRSCQVFQPCDTLIQRLGTPFTDEEKGLVLDRWGACVAEERLTDTMESMRNPKGWFKSRENYWLAVAISDMLPAQSLRGTRPTYAI